MRVKGTTVAIGAAVLLVGYGVATRVWRQADADQASVQTSAEALSARAHGAKSGGDLDAGSKGAKKPVPHMSKFMQGTMSDAPVEFEAPSMGDPNTPTPEEAREQFDAALAQLDQAIAGEVMLSLEEERRIYASLTGSFEVLSAHVSPNNPEQMAFLETAHAEMLQKLREAEFEPPRPGNGERPIKSPHRHQRHRRLGAAQTPG